jgi:hypothetical protein
MMALANARLLIPFFRDIDDFCLQLTLCTAAAPRDLLAPPTAKRHLALQ